LKQIFIALSILFSFGNAFAASANEISGTVTLGKGTQLSSSPQGTLFIFAKKAGTASGNGVPPIAVVKIQQPKFPVNFSLSEANVMMPGSKFEGPLTVYARYSPSGDVMDKSGPEGTSGPKAVQVGQKNLKIDLNPK
jgi:hypothetical protein